VALCLVAVGNSVRVRGVIVRVTDGFAGFRKAFGSEPSVAPIRINIAITSPNTTKNPRVVRLSSSSSSGQCKHNWQFNR